MNTENMQELLNKAKNHATTGEARSLINDLEALIDLYNQKDDVQNGEKFAQSVLEARQRFLISLGKAAASLGLSAPIGQGLFPKPEEYSPEQLEKLSAMQRKLEESVSSISGLQKLKNHTKARS
jgi:hypothetical protein